MPLSPDLAALLRWLPESLVGTVDAIQPITVGLSGAGVYAVSSTRGELVLRVTAADFEAARWSQQLRVQRLAAERGIAPAIVHVHEPGRAVVSMRVMSNLPPGAVFMIPGQRERALGSVVDQLRVLHAFDPAGITARDPITHAREHYAAQRKRAAFPSWADALEAVLDELAATLARDSRLVVSHNDVNPGNILWDGTRAWLVDFEVAGLAHPFYDLAALAMFLQLPDDAALGLLSRQEQRVLEDRDRASFAALRTLAAVGCGLVLASKLDDLGHLPTPAPTLADFYRALVSGEVQLQQPRGLGMFAAALLRRGVDGKG